MLRIQRPDESDDLSAAPTAIVLQTEDDVPPGLLLGWAERRAIDLEVVRVDEELRLPAACDYDFAVALGSSASVHRDPPAWVGREIDWLVAAERRGVPVLGICFGAQALAVAHGGSVDRLPAHEIGWIEVRSDDPRLVPEGPWVTWREDRIHLPPFGLEIARNRVGVQAFVIGRHVGVQFHPEATPRTVARWADDEPDVVDDAVGSRAALEADTRELAPAAHEAATRLFDAFAHRAGVRIDRPTVAVR
jgi:GMP synthase-like glutamine amidotransferase